MKSSVVTSSSRIFFSMTVAVAAAFTFASSAHATSAAWNVNANGNWDVAGSWDANGIPGSTSLTNSTDIATFGFTLAASGKTVTVDANRNIGGITFSNTSGFGYTLSSGNLLLSNTGVIQTASGNGNHTDTISSAIAIQGDGGSATFTADATSATSLLSIGAVTGVSTGSKTTTLTLNGTNTGANAVTGIIGNGSAGGKVAVVKNDAGTWILSGANTFTGGVTLNAGTLNINNATALGDASNGFVINGGIIRNTSATGITTSNYAQTWNGDFTFSGTQNLNLGTGAVNLGTAAGTARTLNVTANTLTIGGAISNGTTASSLVKTGAGTLALSVANSYSGTTSILAGTAQISSATSFGSSTSDILLGDTTGSANAAITIGTFNFARNITLQSGNSGIMTLNAGTNASSFTGKLTLGSAGGTGKNVTLSGAGGQNGGGFTGVIADPTGLSGPGGVVTFNQTFNINSFGNANSTFSGGISFNNVNSGNNNNFLAFNAGNIFGTGPVTINGLITRQSGSNNITGTNNQIWNGDWTIQGGSSGTLLLNLSGTIDLGSLSSATTNVLNANSATRTIYASGLGSIAGNIQDGSNSITKNFSMGTTDPAGWTGGSTLTLSGANIYTGTTSIRNGTLSISSIKNVGGGASNVGAPTNAANGTISIGAGPFTGGLLYTGTAQDTDRVINLAGGAGGATLTQSGTGLLKYATAMTATGLGSKTLTLQGSTAGTGEIGGAIVDNGTTGSTLLNTSFATAASTITLASVDGVVVGAAISGTGIAGGTTVTAINPTTKVVTLSANTTGAGSSGTTITVAGVANLTSVTKSGTGTWTLSGANTYSGNTTVTAGTLKTGLANAIPSGSGKGNVVLDGGPSAGTFDINGFDVGFNGLSGTTGAVSGKVVNNATGTNKTLTVGNNDATATFAGVIADNTSGSGTVALTKTGAGTQTLAGTNTYTGATIINGGILAISGSITSAVTVNNAGTLAGTGTIGGATTVKGGGTHAAGSSVGAVGTQIFSDNLTYASDTATSSIFAWDLNSSSTSSGFDKVTGAVGKTLTIDNSLALDPIFKIVIGTGAATGIADSGNTFWDSQQTWSTIFNGFGSIAGGFSNYQVVDSSGAAFSSVRGSFSVTGTSVSWSAVPEPSAALGGLLLGAGLLRRRRRTGIAGSSGLQGSRRQR